jgi:hypothetical protein
MTSPALYSRVVAGFAEDAPPAVVDAVIELARCLNAELQAVLLEDALTLALAEMPASRAFDPREAVWRELPLARLRQQMELAASVLQRRLETAQAVGVRAQFTVARGGPTTALGGFAQAGDLLVVVEPADPMARWVQPFAGLLQAALATEAALLYLPRRSRTRDGPVAFFGDSASARELARRLAQALDATLITIEIDEGGPAPSLAALLPRLRARRVRVVVCDRAALAADARLALHEAGDQRVAVLVAPAEA